MYGYSAQSSQRQTILRKALLLLGVLVVVVLAVVFISSLLSESNKDFSKSFLTLVQKKDVDASYALTTQSFQANTSKDQWKKTLERINPFIQGDLKARDNQDKNSFNFQPKDSKYILTTVVVVQDKQKKVDYFSSQLSDSGKE